MIVDSSSVLGYISQTPDLFAALFACAFFVFLSGNPVVPKAPPFCWELTDVQDLIGFDRAAPGSGVAAWGGDGAWRPRRPDGGRGWGGVAARAAPPAELLDRLRETRQRRNTGTP